MLIGLLGGLAIFLFGLDQLTDMLKATAGARMRDVLARVTTNRFKGVLAGGFTTAVIQSSSVTTVLVVGFISALLPDEQIAMLIGENSLSATLIGSVVGALFYFATLTEVPITQALMEHGMAPAPALALLLAGPALSLPNMLVLIKVMGVKKTAAFSVIIVIAATITGLTYGRLG